MAVCTHCGQQFELKTKRSSKFCSSKCRNRARYVKDRKVLPKEYYTSRSYAYIDGHWDRYFKKLLRSCGTRHDKEIIQIDYTDLLDLLEQQTYRCALSGSPMTCRLSPGVKFQTNASIDRIDPKGNYTPDNIQLVCAALNSFRRDLNLQEFIGWCVAVAEKHKQS